MFLFLDLVNFGIKISFRVGLIKTFRVLWCTKEPHPI